MGEFTCPATRTVLDDPAVDAVILATPVHWHAPGTMVACEAGKHVYVEKPCSHNVREGRHKVDVPLEGQNTETHAEDFIDVIRNDRRANAHAEIAHRTASICHLGNIATKLRRTLQFDPDQEQFVGDDEANGMVGRPYRAHHWAAPQHV